MLYKPTSRPSKYIFLLCYLLLKKVIENMFWIFKLHVLRNGIVQHKKNLQFLSIHFPENEKKKLFRNDSSFLINLKRQNKYYPENQHLVSVCRRTSLHAVMSPISVLKRNLWWYWKWQTFDDHFSWRQKVDLCPSVPSIC